MRHLLLAAVPSERLFRLRTLDPDRFQWEAVSTWAEAVGPDGHTSTAELRAGEGVRATAAIAAETTQRVLAGAKPGAWTAGQLFGATLVTDSTGAQVTVNGQPA